MIGAFTLQWCLQFTFKVYGISGDRLSLNDRGFTLQWCLQFTFKVYGIGGDRLSLNDRGLHASMVFAVHIQGLWYQW